MLLIVNTFYSLKKNKYKLSYLYFLLAIFGAVFPMISNYNFAIEYGPNFDIMKFIQLASNNPAAESISRDLFIGASAIFIWIINESKKLNIKNMWIVYIGTFLIAFAFSAPLFLFLRERRLIEISENN